MTGLPWSDPASNPLKDVQDMIALYISDEYRAQCREVERLLHEAIPLYAHPTGVFRLHIVYQDGCSPAVASNWWPR